MCGSGSGGVDVGEVAEIDLECGVRQGDCIKLCLVAT